MENEELMLASGAFVSPEDPRNWTLASVGAPVEYPRSASIKQDWMTPSMQGKIGCCVGCTYEEIVRKIVYELTGVQEDLSWRFVYAVCKALDATADEGTFPSLAAKVVRKYGVPLAKFCPNDVSLDHETFVYGRKLENIPAEAFADALTRRAGADITEPVSAEGIMRAINYAMLNNGGVAILRQIGDTYWKNKNGVSSWEASDIIPLRPPKEIISGHEEFLYAYDHEDVTDRIRIYSLNHWSEKWGVLGRGWEYLDEWLPFIKELRVTVAALPLPPENFRYTFAANLSKGMKGADVVALQHVLKLEDCFDYPTFTGYYGDATMSGVKKLQEKYFSDILAPISLSHGTGNFGSATRAFVNKKYGLIK